MSITSHAPSSAEVNVSSRPWAARFVVREAQSLRLPPLIYLAGPYTHPDPVENTHHMIRIADALLDLDVVPIVPHLSMFWHLLCPRPYGDWLTYDLHLLLRCDAVLRVPGVSSGADGELRVARRLGIPVLLAETRNLEDCVAAIDQWLEDCWETSVP